MKHIIESNVEPSNTNVLWLDGDNNLYNYNKGKWVKIGGSGGDTPSVIKVPLKGLKFGSSNLDGFNPENFDTTGDNAPTDLSRMFASANSGAARTDLNLSSWDFSKVTKAEDMFSGANIGTLTMTGLTFSAEFDGSQMFEESAIQHVDFSNNSFANTTNVNMMFSYSNAGTFDLHGSNFNLSTNILDSMFNMCLNLKVLNMTNVSMPTSVESVKYMFYNCSSLTTLDLSSLHFSNLRSIESCFGYCSSLQTLNIANWNLAQATSTANAFKYCSKLENLSIGNLPDYKADTYKWGFETCTALTRESLVNILNALPTTTQTGAKITIGAKNVAKLTDEDKAIATSKGWVIA